jgi:FkbM family methyltransferase
MGAGVSGLRPAVRRLVERHVPLLARSYRAVKDEVRAARERAVPTPFGFALAGDASMQGAGFEPAETGLLRRWLADADVFVDVGANVGFYTCLAKQMGRSVLAVEPLEDNLRYLYRNLTANGWQDVEVLPLGLAATPGLMTLYGARTGASLVAGWAGVSAEFSRTIPISTLDLQLRCRFPDQRLVVKIDVEGAEHDVLLGASETLRREPRPRWLVEVLREVHHPGGNPRFWATFDLFRAAGYRVFQVDERDTPVADEDLAAWRRAGAAPETRSWAFVDERAAQL